MRGLRIPGPAFCRLSSAADPMLYVPGGVLSLPAMVLAGGAASAHCALMCGAVSVAQSRAAPGLPQRQVLLLVHAGRVAGYASMGMAAGALGQALLSRLPAPALGHGLQLLAAFTLVATGAWLLAHKPQPACCLAPPPGGPRWPTRAGLFLRGVLWALMPCALLYAVLLLAALSGSAAQGAALTGAFALGGSPVLATIGLGGFQHRFGRRSAAWWLIGTGVIGLAGLWWMGSAVLPWCTTGHA